MPYDRFKHHRRSIRLKGYDYSQSGAYFVTMRTQDRGAIFGEVVDGVMKLNESGRMVETVWLEIPILYSGIGIDVFQIMPNHFHGIIIIEPDIFAPPVNPGKLEKYEFGKSGKCGKCGKSVGATPRGCPFPQSMKRDSGIGDYLGQGQARGPAPTGRPAPTAANSGIISASRLSLPDVVHRFKTMTTKRYADGVKNNGWPVFSGRFWQRNYYERIIRDQGEFDRIRQYIVNNPANWIKDIEHPANPGATTRIPDDICKEV